MSNKGMTDRSADINAQQSVPIESQQHGEFPLSHTSTSSITLAAIPNSLIAGYVAGVCGTIIGHPFDSIKVLLQTRWNTPMSHTTVSASTVGVTPPTTTAVSTALSSSKSIPHGTLVYRNIMSMTATTMASTNSKTRITPFLSSSISLRSLYAGVSGPLLTVGFIQCINFSIYDTCRQYLYHPNSSTHRIQQHTNRIFHKDYDHDDNLVISNNKEYLYQDSIFNVGLSSFISGGIVSVITSPLAIIKTKQQIMSWDFKQAWRDTTTLIGPTNTHSFTISKLFIGFGPHFICESLGRSVYLMTYESLKRTCIYWNNTIATTRSEDELILGLGQRMICAALSGMTSWSVIFPLDVIRSRSYYESITSSSSVNSSSKPTNKSIWRWIQQMYMENGKRWDVFYRGYGVTILRAGPVAAVVLPVYDMTLEWLITSRQ